MTEIKTENPKKSNPEDDVACAWCGKYELLYGPITMNGEISSKGDMVCKKCAERKGITVNQ